MLILSSTILNLVAYMGGHNSGRLLGQFKIGRNDDEEQKWGTRRKEQREKGKEQGARRKGNLALCSKQRLTFSEPSEANS